MATMSVKLEAEGGDKGVTFDDGVFDGVKKITVGKDKYHQSICYIKIEYDKDGKTEIKEHGMDNGKHKKFEVNYPDEYITSVGGTYEHDIFHGTTLIRTLFFKTSHGNTSRTFGRKKIPLVPSKLPSKISSLIPSGISSALPSVISTAIPSVISSGEEFMLESKTGGKLLGFHGREGHFIDAIGAHFFAVNYPLMHFDLQGGNGGNAWDDGAFDGVSKVVVGRNGKFVTYVSFEYTKGGRMVPHSHGNRGDILQEFAVDYPYEYITVVEGTVTGKLTSLKFTTSKGRTSPDFGNVTGNSFEFKRTGFKLVGFRGRSGNVIDAIGAHFAPFPSSVPTPAPAPAPVPVPVSTPTPTPFVPTRSSSSNKIEAVGGKDGETFDDGAFDNVRKVFVGLVDSNISYLKFEYERDGKREIREHGKKTGSGTEVFEIHKDDYITSVKVYHERLTRVITSLTFKTFKGINSQSFGKTSSSMFFLEGGKITGFHGSSSDVLHSLGAYVSRSPTPMLRGKWFQVKQEGRDLEPGPRCSHAIAMVGDKMYSFGGEVTPNIDIDKHLFVFDFKTLTWSIAPPNGNVPELPCLGVCMVAIGTTLYVFGGRNRERKYNGFYSYDTIKSEWKLITHVDDGPTPRSFHAMAADDENIYVFGGVSKTVRLNTLHAYNIVEKKWSELPNPGESRVPRGGSGLAVVDGRIWVVYGFCGDEMDEVHCFDPVERYWTKVETSGEKPWPRSVFALAVVGKYIIISGGEIEMDPEAHVGPGKLDSGAFVLDTESLLWEKLEEGHSPRGWCASTTASLYRKQGLLMFGGKAPTNGRYDDIFFYGVDSA